MLLLATRSASSWRRFNPTPRPRLLSSAPSSFDHHPVIPGFFYCKNLLAGDEYQAFLNLLHQLQPGTPERFGKDVHAGICFPNQDIASAFETRLLSLVSRVPFFNDDLALGVVVLRYGPSGSLPPHVDDPHKYGPSVCTVGFGSPAVLQMQDPSSSSSSSVERVLLEPGAAYVMSGDARYCWLHGIEGGADILTADGQKLSRSTRFALLLTAPRPSFSGALLLRHSNLPGGSALVASERGGVVIDGRAGNVELWDLGRVQSALDQGQFPI